MSQHRLPRVAQLLKEEIGSIVQTLSLPDCGFVTVTAVHIGADLKDARVFFSVIGSAAQQARALAELQRQHGLVQRELARRIVLKYTPRLAFQLDETEAQAAHIDRLLDGLDRPGSA